ncbi:MAG: iron ABC transporter permease [marine benthic group bacterium]|nr:iron ABC transporter permease [Gemmatimonadota bacterium]
MVNSGARYLVLLALLFGGAAVGTMVGPAGLSPGEVVGAFGSGGDQIARRIVIDLRLPRVFGAVLVGASLAVSGAVFQALLRNPLAEPYLLGVSSGAALAAVGALALGLGRLGGFLLPVAALIGGLLAIAIVFAVARVSDRLDTRVLILAGVVVSAFFGACITLILVFSPAETLRSAFFWTLGSLSGFSWRMVAVLAAWAIPASAAAWGLGRHLDALALGEETAAAIGTEVERIKRIAFFLASLLAAVTVSVAGVIGFVGLVVPHAVRMVWGSAHRGLIPTCFLAGGAALLVVDTAARVIGGPVEIPIGVVTAFLGVPFFLVLLRTRGGST